MKRTLEQMHPSETKENKSITYIDLTRHSNRGGGEMTVTFRDGTTQTFKDSKDLTPTGRKRMRELAATSFPEEVVLVHPRGGDEPRHGETGEDIMEGSGKIGPARKTLQKAKKSAPILQQGKIKGSRKGMQTDYGTAKMMPQLQTAVSLINKKLNELVANLSENEENKFKEDPDFRAKLREKAQTAGTKTAINNPEGNPDYDKVIRKAAENEAYELLHAVKLSRRGVKSDDKAVAIPIVGSSLFAESLYKYALVVEDEQTGEKKTGFKNVDEIGGFTKQTTAFRIKLTRDAKLGDARNLQDFDKDTQVECEFVGDPERAKLFEGKKVYLDWNIVRELAKAAEERFKKEGLVKKSIFAENQQAE